MGEAADAGGGDLMDQLSRLGKKVDSAVAKMQETRPDTPNNQHHQIITLHHAEPPKPVPWHSWACVTACLVMFVGLIVMVAMYLDLSRQQQRTQDHISVIYQLIPDLRKMVNEELCRQGKLENCKIIDEK